MDPSGVLRPLDGIDAGGLERYASREELAGALLTADAAVERSLRLLLRADTGAPDELRVAALSASELPRERLLAVLRERGRISLRLAGVVHELGRAAERARGGDARAADGDLAAGVMADLREEVHRLSDVPVRDAAHQAVEEGPLESTRAVPPPREGRRWMAVALGLIALAAVTVAVALLLSRDGPLEEAVAAFERGERVQAAVLLERVLEEDPGNATALLYLARIERRGGRHEQAAELLRRAAEVAPADADVRRELGHLFMERGRSGPAAQQYERAVELDPDGTLGWVGWVRALRAAGDSARAADVLRRAPEEAREVLTRE